LVVERLVHALAMGGLAMGKGILAGLVERVPVGQLHLPEGGTLLRSCDQFQFGSDRRLHRNVFCFNRGESERRRCFLPRLKPVGIRTEHLMKEIRMFRKPLLKAALGLAVLLGVLSLAAFPRSHVRAAPALVTSCGGLWFASAEELAYDAGHDT